MAEESQTDGLNRGKNQPRKLPDGPFKVKRPVQPAQKPLGAPTKKK